MPATIPSDRPVLGRDLETLRERLQRTVLDCCCLLGIPPTLWAEWKRHEAKPIPNPTVALAVRLYDCFPELAPVEPSLGVLRALLAEIMGGASRSTSYRSYWAGKKPRAIAGNHEETRR